MLASVAAQIVNAHQAASGALGEDGSLRIQPGAKWRSMTTFYQVRLFRHGVRTHRTGRVSKRCRRQDTAPEA
jgi:hypothetical protein